MTTKPPSTEPLDEQEHELARIVRALAGGEPPAALDARILKAAANATATQEPRRMRWPAPPKMFWSLGSAAAAVLAVGIGWQMTRPMPHSLSIPAPGTPQLQAVEAPEMQQPTQPPAQQSGIEQSNTRQSSAPAPSNDMAAREPGNPPPLAARPSESESRQRSSGKTESETPQPAAAPIIAPAPPPPAPEAFAQRSRDEQDAVAARSSASSEAHADQPAVAGNIAAMAKAAPLQAAAGRPAEAIAADTSAERAQAFRQAPADWLEHIRQLSQQGRADEARASLAEFRRQYPQHEIPTDLAALLHE